MVDCVSCSNSFDNERAMRIHHKLSHGESIALEETKCLKCGSKFEYYPSDKDGIYCEECVNNIYTGERGILTGEENPNYKGGDVRRKCDWCDKDIKVKRWRDREQEYMFCNNKCRREWRSEYMSCEDKILNVECDYCGEEFERIPSQRRYENEFCGVECRGKWFSENYSGENHPMWKGGRLDYYGTTWEKKRQEQLERDNYSCVHCGRGEEDIEHHLHVHHRKPVREFEDPDDAHFEENLVTLCPKHHMEAEHGDLEV